MDVFLLLTIGGVYAVGSYINDVTKRILTSNDQKYQELLERLNKIEETLNKGE